MSEAQSSAAALAEKIFANPADLDLFLTGLERVAQPLPPHVNLDPQNVQRGLAQLVLTLIELLRQLMELQAIRRMESGSLTDDEIERVGQTFMLLEERMAELKKSFGLEDKDFGAGILPLLDEFMLSRGPSERAACLVAVTRIRHKYTDLRKEGT